ncbi:MAG: thioredoxin domain-containing protein [Campylobacterota bacterium]|nr:thioredoxin domain-containing protein [Campylobacterota bacterium]
MLKLLVTIILLSSTLFATNVEKTVEKFLEKSFKKNRNIVSLKIEIVEKIAVTKLEGWDAFIVSIDATLKAKPKNRQVKQKMIWFSNGSLITQDLVDMKSGNSLKDLVAPTFKAGHYKKENLIYGDVDAEHKVAIFSDPLCPFCRTFVPRVLNEMRKQPKKFAIYYYHLPLTSLHPSAVALVKAAIVAQLQGRKDVVLDLYRVQVNSREKDVKKILAAFNKTMKTNIKPSDINSTEVMKHYKSDIEISEALMVIGTPTMFFDGKIDKSKNKYKEVK